jgi:hypothetical protein
MDEESALGVTRHDDDGLQVGFDRDVIDRECVADVDAFCGDGIRLLKGNGDEARLCDGDGNLY